jgi:hypothetical protein
MTTTILCQKRKAHDASEQPEKQIKTEDEKKAPLMTCTRCSARVPCLNAYASHLVCDKCVKDPIFIQECAQEEQDTEEEEEEEQDTEEEEEEEEDGPTCEACGARVLELTDVDSHLVCDACVFDIDRIRAQCQSKEEDTEEDEDSPDSEEEEPDEEEDRLCCRCGHALLGDDFEYCDHFGCSKRLCPACGKLYECMPSCPSSFCKDHHCLNHKPRE